MCRIAPTSPQHSANQSCQPKSSTRNRVESMVEPAVQAPLELVWTVISFCWLVSGSISVPAPMLWLISTGDCESVAAVRRRPAGHRAGGRSRPGRTPAGAVVGKGRIGGTEDDVDLAGILGPGGAVSADKGSESS